MNEIAILIPSLHRFNRIEGIRENIGTTTKTPYTLYIVAESTDPETIAQCKLLGIKCVVSSGGSYVSAINNAYRVTKEPFLMLGADDIVFTKGWDLKMMKEMDDPKIGVVGHYDDWPIGKTGFHGSHLLIRRDYIEKQSGVEDEPNTIYSSTYQHFQCDIETEQTAMKRGVYAQSKAVIDHNHWVNGKAAQDQTYQNGLRLIDGDTCTYNQRRKNFEQYYLEALQFGKVVPVRKGKLSVIIGSYNAPQDLTKTIQSLYANTRSEFELIIVDDKSTNPRTVEIIREIQQCNVKRFLLDKQGFCNHTWNYGVAKAVGDYIVVCNNDITFSKDWDIYLVDALNKKDVYIASPYQTDPGMLTPYGFHDRAGGINIRGTCYMMTKESANKLFPIPSDLVMWFGDYYLVEKAKELGKESVFVPEATVHHFCSKSSFELEKEEGIYWWILRGDALSFQLMTGIDTKHWQEVIAAHLPIEKI